MPFPTKQCSKCLMIKPISDFSKSKTSRLGVRGDCKICQKHTNLKWLETNRKKANEAVKTWRENNKEHNSEYKKKYYQDNKDYYKDYRDKNADKRRDYISNRFKNDKLFNLSNKVRNLIRMSFIRKSFNKNSKSRDILGCSFEEFKLYLESKFEPWMNWENYGNPKDGLLEPNKTWDIDHIIPLSSVKTEEDVIKLNHYTNLQPLCSYNNRFLKRHN